MRIKNGELITAGDLNEHVERIRGNYERVHRGWGCGNTNNDVEALHQSATAFDLTVANTWFQKADGHLITYSSGTHNS